MTKELNQYELNISFVTEDDVDRDALTEAIRKFFVTKCQNATITQLLILPPYYRCTNCDYELLHEEPYYSYEICPKCNVEFGVDDVYAGKDRESFEKDYYKK